MIPRFRLYFPLLLIISLLSSKCAVTTRGDKEAQHQTDTDVNPSSTNNQEIVSVLTGNKVVIGKDTLMSVGDSVYQKLFPSGKVQLEGKIVNGKKEGRWVSYYEDGTICRENNYLNGVRHGKFVWYYPSGIKVQELDLVQGVWHGEDKYWNKDGSLNSVTTYENGEKIEIRAYKPNYVNTTDTSTYNGEVIWTKD